LPGTLSRLSHVSPALPLSTRVSFIVTHSLARPRAITALLPFYTNPLTPRFLFIPLPLSSLYSTTSLINSSYKVNTLNKPFNDLIKVSIDNYVDSYTDVVNTLLLTDFSISILSIIKKDDLSIYQKQEMIETFIFEDHRYNMIESLKNSSYYTYGVGNNILLNIIKDLTQFLDLIKKNRKVYLKGKPFKYHLAYTDNNILLSVVISTVLPHILKNDDYQDHKVTYISSLIGKSLIKYFLQNEYRKYTDYIKDNPTSSYKLTNYDTTDSILLSKGITYDDFLQKLDSLSINTFSYVSDDGEFIKYGFFLISVISDNSKLFKIEEEYVEDNTTLRYFSMADNARNDLLHPFSYDFTAIPMIYSPNDWRCMIHETQSYSCKKYETHPIVNLRKDSDSNNNFNDNTSNSKADKRLVNNVTSKDELNYTSPYSNYKFEIIKKGGYLKYPENHFMRKSYKNLGEINFVSDEVLRSVNSLQKVPFIINKDVLKVLLKSSYIIENVTPLNFHPDTHKLNSLIRENKTLKGANTVLINDITKFNSLVYYNRDVLSKALIFEDMILYFPIFIDWRGRYYTTSSAFSYQGSDLSKSLFLFKNGSILNEEGVDRMMIYAGRCYGYPCNKLKKSFSNTESLNWVKNNIELITDVDSMFWLKADAPFQALAVSLELRRYLQFENKKNLISNLPIYIDATCNGLQHLAAMCKEVSLAKLVNLTPSSEDDKPGDVYTAMSEYVSTKLNEDIIKRPELSKLLLINLNRSFIKRGIMTIPYGVTVMGITKQLKKDCFIRVGEINGVHSFKVKSEYIDSNKSDCLFNSKEIYALSNIIHGVLFNTYSNIKDVVDYLKYINKLFKDLGSDFNIFWKTPSGIVIEQRYVETKNVELVTNILGRRRSISINKPLKDKPSLRRQNQSIIPNIIHSLDATHVTKIVLNFLNKYDTFNLLTIHDCFATNANFIDELNYFIRVSFLKLYTDKEFIVDYHNSILNHLKSIGFTVDEDNNIIFWHHNNKIKKMKLPILPKLDDYRLDEGLLNSVYMVH